MIYYVECFKKTNILNKAQVKPFSETEQTAEYNYYTAEESTINANSPETKSHYASKIENNEITEIAKIVFETAIVKYIDSGQIKTIDDYDLRQEGILYNKITEEESPEDFALFRLQEAKNNKINEMLVFWKSLNVKLIIPIEPCIINGIEQQSIEQIKKPTEDFVKIFERIKSEPYYIENEDGSDVLDDEGNILKSNLSEAETQIIYKELLNIIDIIGNATRKNKIRINQLQTVELVESFDIRTKGDGNLFTDEFFNIEIKKKIFNIVNTNEIVLTEDDMMHKELIFNIKNDDNSECIITLPSITKNINDLGTCKIYNFSIQDIIIQYNELQRLIKQNESLEFTIISDKYSCFDENSIAEKSTIL